MTARASRPKSRRPSRSAATPEPPVDPDAIRNVVMPAALADLPFRPFFVLRDPDQLGERVARRYRFELRAAGLRCHTSETFRVEALSALRSRYEPETYEASRARLTAFWAAVDQGETVDPDEEAAVKELGDRLEREHPPLARMAADNERFFSDSLRIAASMALAGWAGLDVPYDLVAGRIPIATIDAIERALGDAETRAGKEAGGAWAELGAACLARISPAPQADSAPDNGKEEAER